MYRTLSYTTENILMIYNNLKNAIQQQSPRDFEIRLDDLTSVARGNDLGRFNRFKIELSKHTREVLFILYKGKSRHADKYLLVRKPEGQILNGSISHESVQKEVRKRLEYQQKELEYIRLHSKVKKQKKKMKLLKQKIMELESSVTSPIETVQKVVSSLRQSGMFSDSSNSDETLGGIPTKELLQMLKHCHSELGEENFQIVLGIDMKLVEHRYLIPEVEKFIKSKIEKTN